MSHRAPRISSWPYTTTKRIMFLTMFYSPTCSKSMLGTCAQVVDKIKTSLVTTRKNVDWSVKCAYVLKYSKWVLIWATKTAGIWSCDLRANERPGSDHVTWGPMRGLKKIAWEGDIKQTHTQTHTKTLWLLCLCVIDPRCFRVFGPYFIEQSPCTTCRLTFEFRSNIVRPYKRTKIWIKKNK